MGEKVSYFFPTEGFQKIACLQKSTRVFCYTVPVSKSVVIEQNTVFAATLVAVPTFSAEPNLLYTSQHYGISNKDNSELTRVFTSFMIWALLRLLSTNKAV